jgi:23S rRNA maturation mini-RNase III
VSAMCKASDRECALSLFGDAVSALYVPFQSNHKVMAHNEKEDQSIEDSVESTVQAARMLSLKEKLEDGDIEDRGTNRMMGIPRCALCRPLIQLTRIKNEC